MTMREILGAGESLEENAEAKYLAEKGKFPTDTSDWDDDVWAKVRENGPNEPYYEVYESSDGYCLVISQAEPLLYELTDEE